MEIIRCSKCKKEIPKQYKKKYKFLWWNFEYSKYETDYYHMGEGFGIDLCLNCMKLFKKWILITPTQAQISSESLNKDLTDYSQIWEAIKHGKNTPHSQTL